MPRYNPNPDSEPLVDGDSGFVGVNATLDPGLLRPQYMFRQTNEQLTPPGMVSHAENKRFFRGQAETRKGSVQPVQFNPSGGWGANGILGTGTFSDPNGGYEWLLIATTAGVYLCKDGSTPTRLIPYADGISVSGSVEMVQAFDRVIMFRGTDLAALQWDGLTTGSFDVFPAPASNVYIESMPNADFGVVMNSRMFVPYDRDKIAVSDILDYTSWDQALNSFRVNFGEDDEIIGLGIYRRSSLIVFKRRSLHRITMPSGSVADAILDVVNPEVGCVARRTIAQVGGDIFWLSDEGVMRFVESVEDSMVTQEVPVSEPIRPYIDRINWAFAHLSSARVIGRYYYLAVPLDSDTVPKNILVFDTVEGVWQGIDSYPAGVRFDRLHAARFLNRQELISVNRALGWVTVHNHGKTDNHAGTEYAIPDLVRTRGYVAGSQSKKRWARAEIEIATWNPSVSVVAIVEGVNERRTLQTITRDRTKYLVHGLGTHDTTNGAIHKNPHRQDYRILAGDNVTAHVDLDPELEQTSMVGFDLRDEGRWISLEISNASGSCSVRTAYVEATPRSNLKRQA